MRLTEYHCGVAVLKSKDLDAQAAAKLADYEDIGLDPTQVAILLKALEDIYHEAKTAMFARNAMSAVVTIHTLATKALEVTDGE